MKFFLQASSPGILWNKKQVKKVQSFITIHHHFGYADVIYNNADYLS